MKVGGAKNGTDKQLKMKLIIPEIILETQNNTNILDQIHRKTSSLNLQAINKTNNRIFKHTNNHGHTDTIRYKQSNTTRYKQYDISNFYCINHELKQAFNITRTNKFINTKTNLVQSQ